MSHRVRDAESARTEPGVATIVWLTGVEPRVAFGVAARARRREAIRVGTVAIGVAGGLLAAAAIAATGAGSLRLAVAAASAMLPEGAVPPAGPVALIAFAVTMVVVAALAALFAERTVGVPGRLAWRLFLLRDLRRGVCLACGQRLVDDRSGRAVGNPRGRSRGRAGRFLLTSCSECGLLQPVRASDG